MSGNGFFIWSRIGKINWARNGYFKRALTVVWRSAGQLQKYTKILNAKRRAKSSAKSLQGTNGLPFTTIFCSQFLDDGWYERIGSEDNPLSDSIMDRIKYDAYKISIKAIDAKHDKSMREVYGLKASESH